MSRSKTSSPSARRRAPAAAARSSTVRASTSPDKARAGGAPATTPAVTPPHPAPAAPAAAGASAAALQAWLDRSLHAGIGRLTGGLSPAALGLAGADWWIHLLSSPGKQMALATQALQSAAALGEFAALASANPQQETPCCEPVTANDRRFQAPGWQRFPYNVIQQSFRMQEAWWTQATHGVRGVSPHHEQLVGFVARQMLDMMAPTNAVLTNPEVAQATLASGGMNLAAGTKALSDDLLGFWRSLGDQRALRSHAGAGEAALLPGRAIAATPGKVVLRNRLVELIQYTPTTAKTWAEPVLIVPAWIMKYYILDLSASNSLVRYLVDQGHTVFMLSWKNPDGADRDLGMDDYLQLGPLAALDAIQALLPKRRVHAAGYCLGGTLLTVAAALLAKRGDTRLASCTLLASQTDFSEAGELSTFIDDSQLSFLEDTMWAQGYLDAAQMAGAFQMLRSYDLIWSRMTQDYLLGQRRPPTDLTAWNADTTRMPYRMHSEYLRGMYLENRLAEGHWKALEHTVAVDDLTLPMFVVGTETDHVAPWRSVYKIHLLTAAPITFVLTNGGHNAGIVSEPGHPGRHYRWSLRRAGGAYSAPQTWLDQAQQQDGSWWPRWSAWLAAHSSAQVNAPKPRGSKTLGDAPGHYVLQH